MFHFLKKYKNTNLEWIGVDMHSHLLPGIDDGAKTTEASIFYIKGLKELGFNKLIITPHVFRELYPNDPTIILTALDRLKSEPEIQNMGMQLEAAAEYMINADFDPLLKKGEILCLYGNHVLIEMSYVAETPNIEQYIFDLKIRGFQPVLAHPERYEFYHSDFMKYKRLREMGCLMQLNLLSPVGYYGKEVKKAAMKLIDEGFVDLVGTDLHHERHLEALKNGVTKGKLSSGLFNNLVKNIEWSSVSLN